MKIKYLFAESSTWHMVSLQWRQVRVSNHRQVGCLLNNFFRLTTKKHQSGIIHAFSEGSPPGSDGFPSQRASYRESVSMVLHHHIHTWLPGRARTHRRLRVLPPRYPNGASCTCHTNLLWPIDKRKSYFGILLKYKNRIAQSAKLFYKWSCVFIYTSTALSQIHYMEKLHFL